MDNPKWWTQVTWNNKSFTVPVVGPDNNLNAMLTEIPGQEEGGEEVFMDHAMAFLMQDGNLGVPGGRYGSDTRTCARLAIMLAHIMSYNSGDSITYYALDSDMGIVVNSHDDVAYMIVEYGEITFGDKFDPSEWLDEETINEVREQSARERGE
jgi:hypothetical protein